jgi:hypothetical protein
MKYVINTRGGAKQVEDNSLEPLLSSGYIEITQKQFEDKKYYPEYDKGDQHQVTSAVVNRLQIQKNTAQPSRTSFQTRIV